MEHELQANKLHIQALMQQLHAIAAKQALGESGAAADQAANDMAAQQAAPAEADPVQQRSSSTSSPQTAATNAAPVNEAMDSSPGCSGGSCCSSSGGSAFTPVRSFSCSGVANSPGSSEAISRCRPAGASGMHLC
jgi:septal ring factor EnvC (AmiA/AmiB activator)